MNPYKTTISVSDFKDEFNVLDISKTGAKETDSFFKTFEKLDLKNDENKGSLLIGFKLINGRFVYFYAAPK